MLPKSVRPDKPDSNYSTIPKWLSCVLGNLFSFCVPVPARRDSADAAVGTRISEQLLVDVAVSTRHSIIVALAMALMVCLHVT